MLSVFNVVVIVLQNNIFLYNYIKWRRLTGEETKKAEI